MAVSGEISWGMGGADATTSLSYPPPLPVMQVEAKQMAVAVSGEISWGMGGADAMDPEDLSSIDWRLYTSSGNSLNDKQQKLVERVRCVLRVGGDGGAVYGEGGGSRGCTRAQATR